MIFGVSFVDFLDKKIPHDHFIKGHEGSNKGYSNKKIALFVLTIIIHNFPEGLAVGIGWFSEDFLSLTLAIGILNALEGLAVTAALVSIRYNANYSAWIALLSGPLIIGSFSRCFACQFFKKYIALCFGLCRRCNAFCHK